MNEDEKFRKAASGRRGYEHFIYAYQRKYGAALPSFDQLSSQSREVWADTVEAIQKDTRAET